MATPTHCDDELAVFITHTHAHTHMHTHTYTHTHTHTQMSWFGRMPVPPKSSVKQRQM